MNHVVRYAGFAAAATALLLFVEAPSVRAGQAAPQQQVTQQQAAPRAQEPAPRTPVVEGDYTMQVATGRRPNPLKPSADLYAGVCAGCHGNAEGTVGRAPALLNEDVLKTLTDEQMTQIVRHGIPGSEMAAFSQAMIPDEQLFNLLFYIRSTAANIKPKPAVVVDPNNVVIHSEKQKFKLEVLSRDLVTPFSMAFLPDGKLLITERPGRIRVYDHGKLSEPIKNTPKPRTQQDAGFLGITPHPDYAKNGWIYLSYSEVLPGWTAPAGSATPTPTPVAPAEGPGRFNQGTPTPANTVIVRGRVNKNNEWVDQQVLFRSPDKLYSTRGEHYGSAFAWDKQNHLFFTLGERGNMANAQDLSAKNSLGKIHRINDDGTVPKDNPFVDKPDTDPTIWAYGNRNPEGLAFNPVTGKLWESEHGPVGGDEINVIEPGHNYGWGVISMGIQPGITERTHAGMDQPVVYYTPSAAPAGISFYTGNRYPGWKNSSLFVGMLVGQRLMRLDVSGDKVTHQEVLFAQYGRVRDVLQGPDGYLYVLLQEPTGVNGLSLSANTPGRLVRLTPLS